MNRFIAVLASGAWSLLAVPAFAQHDYPNKPIRMIVPYPPGGPTDIIGRVTSSVLTKRLAENVVVDNRGGAATAIGAEMAARSPADGYTLLLSSETTFAVTPALKDKLPYHPSAISPRFHFSRPSPTCWR
jgi:tripartite-type tricarboxylate transporter receptor subunit TctC